MGYRSIYSAAEDGDAELAAQRIDRLFEEQSGATADELLMDACDDFRRGGDPTDFTDRVMEICNELAQ